MSSSTTDPNWRWRRWLSAVTALAAVGSGCSPDEGSPRRDEVITDTGSWDAPSAVRSDAGASEDASSAVSTLTDGGARRFEAPGSADALSDGGEQHDGALEELVAPHHFRSSLDGSALVTSLSEQQWQRLCDELEAHADSEPVVLAQCAFNALLIASITAESDVTYRADCEAALTTCLEEARTEPRVQLQCDDALRGTSNCAATVKDFETCVSHSLAELIPTPDEAACEMTLSDARAFLETAPTGNLEAQAAGEAACDVLRSCH